MIRLDRIMISSLVLSMIPSEKPVPVFPDHAAISACAWFRATANDVLPGREYSRIGPAKHGGSPAKSQDLTVLAG
jgi:hypothetical protein